MKTRQLILRITVLFALALPANASQPHTLSPYTLEFEWPSLVEREPDCTARGDAGCIGDNWPVTWRANGSLFTSWGDGPGKIGHKNVSLGFAELDFANGKFGIKPVFSGFAGDSRAYNGNCDGRTEISGTLCGKTYAIIDINGVLWTWISPGSAKTNYTLTRLYRSTDNGKTFAKVRNRAGFGRPWIEFRLADGLILPAFMQAGPGYVDARQHGNFVYITTTRPEDTRQLNVQRGTGGGQIDLVRVPLDALDDLSRYEWFAGTADKPEWSNDHRKRQPIFSNPDGVGWVHSISFVPFLKAYVLLTEHGRSFSGRLGAWHAAELTGPWQRLYKANNWPCGKGAPELPGRRSFYWNLPTGLLSQDTFWMVFTGIEGDDSLNAVRGRFVRRADKRAGAQGDASQAGVRPCE